MGDKQKAIEYHENRLQTAKRIGDRAGEEEAYGNLGIAYNSLGSYRKAIEHLEKVLKITIEINDQAGQERTYHNIGIVYFSLQQFQSAVNNYVSAVKTFNSLRSLLMSKDDWKITFRELHETTYTALWRSLLSVGKVDEALFAAEQGRTQTLSDNLFIQYKLPASLAAATTDTKETVSRLFTELITPTIFFRN